MKRFLLILVIAFMGGALFAAYEQNSRTKKIETSEKYEENVFAEETQSNYLIKNVPLIQQKPELDRGCEVSSLAMLLQHAGVDVGKMELAEKIKKDDTPYTKVNGAYYYGNPNDGFIGDIYTFKNMGYGVYHEPVAELAEKYLPGKIQDMTGSSFEEVIKKVGEGHPVWVIINADFRKLSEAEFRTWNTPSGKVQITWKEHSVVITGFDENNIYINDPLNPEANRKKARTDFKAAWEQMGSQAITIK